MMTMSKDELAYPSFGCNSGCVVFPLVQEKGGEVLRVWCRRRSLNFLTA